MGSSHFTDITYSWGGAGSKCGLKGFCHIMTLLPPGASVFHKHMSSFYFIFGRHTSQGHFLRGPIYTQDVVKMIKKYNA